MADGGLNLGADEANAKAFKEDARLKIELRGDRVYSPNPSVDMKIGAGQFADNERLELFAYLVDVAGNVGRYGCGTPRLQIGKHSTAPMTNS